METLTADSADLLRSGAQKLTGHKRRLFVAEVTLRVVACRKIPLSYNSSFHV